MEQEARPAPDTTSTTLEAAELEEALAELAPRLLRFAVAAIGDRTLAEDATQEALIALVRRWRSVGPPESPEAFAFAIARRRGRRWRVRQRLSIALADSQREYVWDSRVEEIASERQRLDATLRAMRGLSARDREALSIVVGGELDLATAAGILGISVSAMKMRLSRARHRLRGLMEKEDHE